MSGARPTADDIERWLIARLAKQLHLGEDAIDPRHDFAGYGLDSIGAVEIAYELEGWLGRSLEETLLWDYPSIRRLAEHLSGGA